MDHRQITQLRRHAANAREYREKVVVTPDDLDELLDYALAQIEGEK